MITFFILTTISSLFSVSFCSIFLYFFFKYDSIRYTFGMKHVAILQISDLCMSLAYLMPMNFIVNLKTYCQFASFTMNSFLIFQSYWVAVISRYTYLVICLRVEKETISILKPVLIGLFSSLSISAFTLGFDCYQTGKPLCTLKCQPVAEMILYALNVSVFLFSWAVSFYSNWFLLSKLRKDLINQLKEMRWSFIRLSVYPFITFLCLLPGLLSYFISLFTGSIELVFYEISTCALLLIGFFNSIALGFTREFQGALNFHKKLKTQALINPDSP